MHESGKSQLSSVWVGLLKHMRGLQSISDTSMRVLIPMTVSQLSPGTDAWLAWIEDL